MRGLNDKIQGNAFHAVIVFVHDWKGTVPLNYSRHIDNSSQAVVFDEAPPFSPVSLIEL